MKRLLVSIALVGCAEAGRSNSVIGGVAGDAGNPGVDATVLPEPDASPVDAPPEQATLTQTASDEIVDHNSVACQAPDPTVATRPNSYYRVFTLADHSVTSTFHVTQVTFGIELASSGSGTTQLATLNLGTYGAAPVDPLDLAQVRALTSLDIKIPDGQLTRMTVEVTADVAPTTNLIVELAIPRDDTAGNAFFIGTNTSGERKPGFVRAPTCTHNGVPISLPTNITTIAGREVDIVMTVTGTQIEPPS